MRRLPPLNAVRAFEAAARRGNFNQAAEELNVTPSAISHQVRVLEEFFGVKLFRRSGRRVELMPKARDLLRSVTQALDQIHAASQRMMQRPEGNLLNITVSPTFATGWLVPHLSDFQHRHPELEIRMATATPSSTALSDFIESDFDLFICYSAGGFPAELASVRVMAEHCVPVCSPDYVAEHGPLETPEDIRGCTLLHALPRSSQWQNWLDVAGVREVDARRGPKFPTTPLALEAATSGLGVAIANLEFVEDHIRRGTLVAPFQVEVPSESGYYLVYPREHEDEPKLQVFRTWLLDSIEQTHPDRPPSLHPA